MPARLPESGQCGSRGHCRLVARRRCSATPARPPAAPSCCTSLAGAGRRACLRSIQRRESCPVLAPRTAFRTRFAQKVVRAEPVQQPICASSYAGPPPRAPPPPPAPRALPSPHRPRPSLPRKISARAPLPPHPRPAPSSLRATRLLPTDPRFPLRRLLSRVVSAVTRSARSSGRSSPMSTASTPPVPTTATPTCSWSASTCTTTRRPAAATCPVTF